MNVCEMHFAENSQLEAKSCMKLNNMNHLIDNESRDSHHSCHNNENEKCSSPLLYENDDISCVYQ